MCSCLSGPGMRHSCILGRQAGTEEATSLPASLCLPEHEGSIFCLAVENQTSMEKCWKDYSSIWECSSLGGTVFSLRRCPGNVTLCFTVPLAFVFPKEGPWLRHQMEGQVFGHYLSRCPPPARPQPTQELVMMVHSFCCCFNLYLRICLLILEREREEVGGKRGK